MRVYTVEFENVVWAAASGDIDIFSIQPADDKPVKILGAIIDQLSDVGDAQEEMARYRFIRGHTTVGSGGAAPTPTDWGLSGVGAGFTARTNDTVIASVGTPVNGISGGFNIRAGLQLWLPPEAYGVGNQASLVVMRLMAALADDVTCSGTLFVGEEG